MFWISLSRTTQNTHTHNTHTHNIRAHTCLCGVRNCCVCMRCGVCGCTGGGGVMDDDDWMCMCVLPFAFVCCVCCPRCIVCVCVCVCEVYVYAYARVCVLLLFFVLRSFSFVSHYGRLCICVVRVWVCGSPLIRVYRLFQTELPKQDETINRLSSVQEREREREREMCVCVCVCVCVCYSTVSKKIIFTCLKCQFPGFPKVSILQSFNISWSDRLASFDKLTMIVLY